MIDENELEELKEQICRLATKPQEKKWLRDKTDAGEELFGEALDDLRDSRHIKEENGKVTALRLYSKKTAVAAYCPACGARVIGDECPVCKAKVAVGGRTFFGKLFTILVTGLKALIVIVIILAIIGAMSSRATTIQRPQTVEMPTAPVGARFDHIEFTNGWCLSNGRPVVYQFGDGDAAAAEIIKMLSSQFTVDLQVWLDARNQPLPRDKEELVKKYGGYVPMTVFGCKYVFFGKIQKGNMPEATAMLCDITGQGSALCQDSTVRGYIEQLYARFPR